MAWHHQRVIDGFHEGTTLPKIIDYLVGDDGTRVQPIGASRGMWLFRCSGRDLQFLLDASSTSPSPTQDDYSPPPLGPVCRIGFHGDAQRISTFDEPTRVWIAEVVVGALLAHHLLPRATPPPVEQVEFSAIAKQAIEGRFEPRTCRLVP